MLSKKETGQKKDMRGRWEPRERLFAWLHWFRRLVTRYEYHVESFLGMVRLACVMLLLKHLR